MERNAHLGINLLDAERDSLLDQYDKAVKEADADPVKTEHGVAAEAIFRNFLANFLPKKFGVTKGHILSPTLKREFETLEEWDIIVYDALESPVYAVRRTANDHESGGRRVIPIEHVRAVIEVKATFNRKSAENAVNKLLKLDKYGTGGSSLDEGSMIGLLHERCFRTVVFFETNVETPQQFANALDCLSPLTVESEIPWSGGLIIRGHTCHNCSARLDRVETIRPEHELLARGIETGKLLGSYHAQDVGTDLNVYMGSHGFGENEFWRFMQVFLAILKGSRGPRSRFDPQIQRFGTKFDKMDLRALFPHVD